MYSNDFLSQIAIGNTRQVKTISKNLTYVVNQHSVLARDQSQNHKVIEKGLSEGLLEDRGAESNQPLSEFPGPVDLPAGFRGGGVSTISSTVREIVCNTFGIKPLSCARR